MGRVTEAGFYIVDGLRVSSFRPTPRCISPGMRVDSISTDLLSLANEVDFVAVVWFDSIEAARAFAV